MEKYLKAKIKEYKDLEEYYLNQADKLEKRDNFKLNEKNIKAFEDVARQYTIRKRENQKA